MSVGGQLGVHQEGLSPPPLLHRLGRTALHRRGWDLIAERGRSERCSCWARWAEPAGRRGVGEEPRNGFRKCFLKSPGTPQASKGGLSAASDIRVMEQHQELGIKQVQV